MRYLLLVMLLFSYMSTSFASLPGAIYSSADDNKFAPESAIEPLSTALKDKIIGSTWFQGCPLDLDDLALVRVPYFSMDQKTHTGILIVNKKLAQETLEIFNKIYVMHFPIQSMQLIDNFHGKKRQYLTDINTIAFNCRAMTGNTKVFSRHSYGVAIDINPLQNPFVSNKLVVPAKSVEYKDRSTRRAGMIFKNDPLYLLFIKNGWRWGGDWTSPKDYMHFEKTLK